MIKYCTSNRVDIDLQGTPKDVLRGPAFKNFVVAKVMPAVPIWPIDTVAGILTMVLLGLLLVAIVIAIILLVAKRKGYCCFKTRNKYVQILCITKY